ncbi:MAG TPA: hypothetical protein VKB86_20295 [Pyrinomonadaceae bacterium]|nr:hypothetical protein [Pyrinomonadaceae bacterium]
MKAPSHSSIKHILFLLTLFLLPASAIASQAEGPESTQQAKELWEQAIAAKGGREQLYKVNSLVISYQETVRNFLGIVVHHGAVETLYLFPDRMWSWDDGLPPPFHLTVGVLDLSRNLRCTLYEGAKTPVCGPAKQGASPAGEGLSQAQYLYLMETRWVKPVPLNVTKDSIGLKKVDVLHTRFENKRIDYFLDQKTHLPSRVAVFYGAGDRPTLTVDLSEYASINGIQMPGKQKRGRINFQINPSYDESIFTRPPSIEAGPKAWQRAF